MIEVKTTIGFGPPNLSGKSDVHGAPLGKEELKLTKEAYKWTFETYFFVPEEVYRHFHTLTVAKGKMKEEEWNQLYARYGEEYPN